MSDPIRSGDWVLCACRWQCGRLVQKGRGVRRRVSPECAARLRKFYADRKTARIAAEREAKRRDALEQDTLKLEQALERELAKVKGKYRIDPWSRPGSGTEEHAISRALRSTRGRGAA